MSITSSSTVTFQTRQNSSGMHTPAMHALAIHALGYELDKLREKKEKEGVTLTPKTKHKRPPAKSSTYTMSHD